MIVNVEKPVAVVSGGGSGIGLATARLLAEQGMRVFAIDLSLPADAMDGVIFDSVDIRSASATEDFVSDVVEQTGRIDVLVNSAGILRWGGTVDTEIQDWDDLFETNVKGTWLLSRAAVAHMRSRKSGSIVHVASNMGMKGIGNQVAYSASKGAIIALTRSMAVELGQDGIRVNCVNPGHIRTPMGNSASELLGLTDEGIRAKYPLGRIGDAEEVAESIAYLAGNRSSFITGTILAVDGGYCA